MKRLAILASAAVLVVLLAAVPSAGTVYLKSGLVETEPASDIAASESPAVLGSGYYMVALDGPVSEADKAALVGVGARLVEYLPDFAFLVRIEHSKVDALRKLGCVEWVGPFKPEYKRAGKVGSARARQFVVRLFSGQTRDFVLGKARLLGIKKIACGESVCRVLATDSQIDQLARSSAVSWVEPYLQPRLCNNVAQGICGLPDVRQDLGLYGLGQIIGVADAGLDTGNTSTISADFASRILKTYGLRRPGEWSDLNGHGSHVVGSLLGAGVLSGAVPSSHSYAGSFAGYAPESQLVFQSIGDSGALVFPPLHLAELFQPAYEDGVRVHSDSWGSAAHGDYTTYSNEVDQFVWDHKDFTVTFAVGNDAEDLDQNGVVERGDIYAPATAKNCIAVGATESDRATGGYQSGYGMVWASSYPAAPLKYDLVSNDSSGMTAFSSRGPTSDGRVKPDLCAPGTNIISCLSQLTPGLTAWGGFDTHYVYWGGTSMSTPQVAGAAALVREYYQREKGIGASAALVKATLISGAVDISPGQYGTGSHREVFPAPDYSQGWGRMNAKLSILPDPPTVNEFADESVPLGTGETREYQYSVIDASVPLRATLVWTDYPGAVHAAKELVNDLDLTVVAPSGNSYPLSAAYDRTNNVEQVTLAAPELGTYKVRVTGYNVPMGPQDYALVVSGGMPNTYIAGSVTSSSGAAVQGATVTVVSAHEIKRVTSNLSGKYITHVGPGSYSVQIGKAGWTFTPRARVVTVAGSPVSNVNFQGQGQPGSATGDVTSAVGGVVSRITESSHPYLNNSDQTWVITAHEGVTRVRVHFAELDLMDSGDTVYILDSTDTIKGTFNGRGEDIWSPWVNGNVLKIRLITNETGNIGYGFYSDGYETDLIDAGPVGGATVTLTPGNYSANTAVGGGYSLTSVPPGTYTATASKAHWKFQPASRVIDVPAGGAVADVDFLGFPPGSISGEIKLASSEIRSVNVQSPHPYPNNFEQTWQIDGGASTTRMRLHFAEMSTEAAWDFVYIMDGANNIIEIYTAVNDDLWTPWIDGNVARIMLTSDEGNNDYGFRCDKYEAQCAGGGLVGATVQLTPDNRSVATQALGLFAFGDVDAGAHTVVPGTLPWVFDPPLASVSISPGMSESVLFYAKLGELTAPSQAKMVGDGVQVTVKGIVVSAVFGGFFYAQDPRRVGGMRVAWSGVVHEGDSLDVVGTMATVNGERRITATSVTAH